MNVLNRNIFKECKRAKSDEERKLWIVMKSHTLFFFFFFFEQSFFSTQPQCCLTFLWNEIQMLLRCSLIHISIIIVRHFLYLLYFCPCLDLSLIMWYLCHLFFILIFIFIMIDRIISWMQTHLIFCLFSIILWWRMWIIFQFAKVQPQSVA